MAETNIRDVIPVTWNLPVSIVMLGERVAALEVRIGAEITLRESDMSSIRQSIHDIRQELQSSVGAEHRWALELTKIDNRQQTISATLDRLAADIRDLAADRYKLIGGWWTILRIASAIAVVASITIAALAYMAKKL